MTANPFSPIPALAESFPAISFFDLRYKIPLRQIHLHRIISEFRPSSGDLARRDGFA